MLRILKKCANVRLADKHLTLKANSLHSGPNFTKINYNVTRGCYSSLDENHLGFFYKLLGVERVVTDICDLESYNVDWFKQLRGNSSIVLKPKTTEEVSGILSFCNQQRLAVCLQGGNTSVVGSSVPVFDEIIVTTALMNKIVNLDETSGVLVCQSGCILENLENYVSQKNLTMPLDLGAKGSCHIGGNVSTNAGGIRLLRYGNLHGNITGVEVVKANGEIVDLLSTLRKDNTGYHLKNLFIGSEGTLGFVTKVAIQCPPKPNAANVAFLGLQSYEKVLKAYMFAKQKLGEILSAVEVIDTPSMQLLQEHLGLDPPIGDYPFYLIIETLGSNANHDAEKLNAYLEAALLKHFVLNGTVATEPSKVQAIWNLRDSIPLTFKKDGHVFFFDVTLPLELYYTLVANTRKYMGDKSHRVFGFGHLGDGNLHLQISIKEYDPAIKEFIEPYIFKMVEEMKGSISAEHGMGFLKAKYLGLAKSESSIALMKSIKNMMDPNKILNPYKVFPTN